MNGQTKRIVEHFRKNPNIEIPSVELHRIGSGKELGYLGSFSRRISDCRKLGMGIELTSDRKVEGQRHTFYTYKP